MIRGLCRGEWGKPQRIYHYHVSLALFRIHVMYICVTVRTLAMRYIGRYPEIPVLGEQLWAAVHASYKSGAWRRFGSEYPQNWNRIEISEDVEGKGGIFSAL